ncbi:MAG: flagellar protein FliT [Lachnospiraceae bacterium]|nr:flagellar protein FliT [Lachnospiraceae bacterium]
MTENYLEMMSDSLRKKLSILQELERLSLRQKEFFEQGDAMDDAAFDEVAERKGALIEELEKLDEGFTSLFEKTKEQIGANKERYAPQIREIQDQIRAVTGVSNAIEAQEKRNKAAADRYFASARAELNHGRKSSGTALLYHQTMNHAQNVTPQFFDSKK